MRTIKFRAYDKTRKEYLSAGQIYLQISPGKNPADCIQYLDVLYNPNAYADRFVIEQFTGMLDKNGNEIYEGDIVRYYDDLENELVSSHVIYHKESCSFCVAPTELCGDYIGICAHWQFEVIGNIHNNPELLKGGSDGED